MQRCLVSKRESNHSEVPPHAHRGTTRKDARGRGRGRAVDSWEPSALPVGGGGVRCSLQHGPPASRSRSSLLPASPDSTSVRGADGGTQSPLSQDRGRGSRSVW